MRNLLTRHAGACVSNSHGHCGPCLNSPRVALAGSVAGATLALTARRRFEADRLALAAFLAATVEDAEPFHLDSVTRAALKIAPFVPLAETPARLAELRMLAERYRSEVDKTLEGLARRNAKAAEIAERKRAREIAEQATVIALRATMALDWTVAIRFFKGGRDIKAVKTADMPKGYREADAAKRARGETPGLRFREAEHIAGVLETKIPNRSRHARPRRRR